MGKGSAPRPMTDYDNYSNNWDNIFGKTDMKVKEAIMTDLPVETDDYQGVVFSYRPPTNPQKTCYCIIMGQTDPDLSGFGAIQALFEVKSKDEAIATWNWIHRGLK